MSTRAARSKRRGPLCLGLTALLVVAAACGEDGVRVLTDDDSGSEVELDQGEQFEVRLDSNPSTGYGWELSAMTSPDLVVLERRTHEAADTDLVGTTGTDVFVFTAVGGAGVLRLEYVRPFDDPVVPERVAEFVVRVDGAAWPPVSAAVASTSVAP